MKHINNNKKKHVGRQNILYTKIHNKDNKTSTMRQYSSINIFVNLIYNPRRAKAICLRSSITLLKRF